MKNNTFGVADYIVFSLMLCVSAGIGIFYRFSGGRQRTTKEYLLADKNMSCLPVAFSLMASFMSAITLLGVSSENYVYGTQFVVINFSYIFGTFLAAFMYLPVFFKLQATSAYEYLDLRFGKIARVIASISFVTQMVLYMSIVLYAPALALSAVTGLSKWTAILSVGIVCTFYSTIGGMKAVLWTDVFQSILMFAAIFAVIIKGLVDSKGFSSIWEKAKEGQRIEFFNFDTDITARATFWTQTFGGIFTYLSVYACNQAQVQRLLTVKDLKTSQISLFLNWPILTTLSIVTSFSGLVIYSKYYDCDPQLSERITSSDQLLPLFVMDFLADYPGVAGLFVSGIFSGALSTVSSALNSLAAVSLEDFIKPFLSTSKITDQKMAYVSKILALLFGVLCIALTYVAEQMGGVLQASLTIFGVVGGPILGLFTLGMFVPFANQKGAVIGFLISLIFCCWIGFGATVEKPYIPVLPQSTDGCPSPVSLNSSQSTFNGSVFQTVSPILENPANESLFYTNQTVDPSLRNKDIWIMYRISYMWLAPLGFFIVIIIGVIISLISGRNSHIDPDLLTPIVAKFYERGSPEAELLTVEENSIGNNVAYISLNCPNKETNDWYCTRL